VIKTDVNGNEEWNNTYGDPLKYRDYLGYDIQQLNDNGYVIVGKKELYDTSLDSYLIKIDSNGIKDWEMTLEGIQTYDEVIYSLDVTDEGGFIVAGEEGYPGDALLIKIGHVPNITITKPEKSLYLFNFKILPFFMPLIIGPICVEVDASDNKYEIEKVEFYLDDKLQETDSSEPYSWNWNTISFFKHILKVVVYNTNNNCGFKEIIVSKFF
jgi:hypothetical protein